MDLLKKIWPTPFTKIEKGNVASLVIQVIIFVVICIIGGVVLGVLNALVGFLWPLWSIIGSLLEIYGAVGIVLSFLWYFNVIKENTEE